MKYRPEIDGLRAFAVLSVIVFHAFPSILRGGFVGVDIFFVISGFLITSIIFKQLETSNFSFLNFFKKRIKRIFPSLILVLLASIIFSWFALLADEYALLGKHVAAGAFFVSNFILSLEAGYFDISVENKPLLHLWSLGIEEQFYILWPAILFLCWRCKKGVFYVTAFTAFISFVICVHYSKTSPVNAFYWPTTRFWQLLSGSILGYLTLYPPNYLKILKTRLVQKNSLSLVFNIASLLGLAILIYAILRIHSGLTFPGKWAAVPVFGTILVIFAGNKGVSNRLFFMNKPMIWIGLISYPLYLWHWPILSYMQIMQEGPPPLSYKVIGIILSFILSWLTYEYIEKKIRFGESRKISEKILLLTLISIGLIGLTIYYAQGFKTRTANDNYRHAEILFNAPQIEKNFYSCDIYMKGFDSTNFGEDHCKILKESPPEILFIGDSHTGHYVSALLKSNLSTSIGIIQSNSCLPFASNDYILGEDCLNNFNNVIDFLNIDKKIHTIVLSAFWNKAISGEVGLKGENWRLAALPTSKDIKSFGQNMDLFMNAAQQNHRKVIFMQDIPLLDFNIRDCFDYRPLRISEKDVITDCAIYKDKLDKYNQPFNKVLKDKLSGYKTTEIYDPKDVLCSSGKCIAKSNNMPIYYNGDHLNFIGADIIIRDMINQGLLK